MAACILAVLATAMPQAEFPAWNWRIDFGLSALLVVIGLVLRLYVQETAPFLASHLGSLDVMRRSVYVPWVGTGAVAGEVGRLPNGQYSA
jgi:hypothetical protein